MSVTQYIGSRYVPLFSDPLDWNIANSYEPLTIVYYSGNSYTSRQYVPSGIDINNAEFWALTGNYNAQVEAYRKEVLLFDGRITENASGITENETKIQGLVPITPNETSSTPKTETFIEYTGGKNNIVYDAAYGTNMIPVTYNPIPALNVANSYRMATNIKYGNEYTATNINEAGTGWEPARNHPDTDGKFHIDCTTLAVLVANGILHSNSTYTETGTNVANNMIMNMFSDTMLQYVGHEFAIEGTPIELPHKRILASELAKMLYDSGRLTPVYEASKTSQFHPADILFISNAPDELHWRGIGHCMIVCCRIGSDILVIDSDMNRGGVNGTVNYRIMSSSEISQVNWKFSIPQIQWPLYIPTTTISRKFTPSSTVAIVQSFPQSGSVNIYNPSDTPITATVTYGVPDPVGNITVPYVLAKNQSVVLVIPAGVNFSCTPSAVGLTYNIQINAHTLATEPYNGQS